MPFRYKKCGVAEQRLGNTVLGTQTTWCYDVTMVIWENRGGVGEKTLRGVSHNVHTPRDTRGIWGVAGKGLIIHDKVSWKSTFMLSTKLRNGAVVWVSFSTRRCFWNARSQNTSVSHRTTSQSDVSQDKKTCLNSYSEKRMGWANITDWPALPLMSNRSCTVWLPRPKVDSFFPFWPGRDITDGHISIRWRSRRSWIRSLCCACQHLPVNTRVWGRGSVDVLDGSAGSLLAKRWKTHLLVVRHHWQRDAAVIQINSIRN